MAFQPLGFRQFGQGGFFLPASTLSTSAQYATYQQMCGQEGTAEDADNVASVITINSQLHRELVLVQNGSGGNISPGQALMFQTQPTAAGLQVTPCTPGNAIRGYAPGYVSGSLTTVIPNLAFFYMVKKGPTTMLSDGTVIAVGNGLIVGATNGQVRNDYGYNGGLVYSAVAASAAVTATTVQTPFSNNYTFPPNSLRAGDEIKITADALCTATNSTDTLTLTLEIGSIAIAATPAIDVATGDGFEFIAVLSVRTAGNISSGTIVGVTLINTATGSTTFKDLQLPSTAIDTTVSQLVTLQAQWSTNNAGNSVRNDVFEVERLSSANAGEPELRGGIALAAAAGAGPSVNFRGMANCFW